MLQKCTFLQLGHAYAVPSPQPQQTPGSDMWTGAAATNTFVASFTAAFAVGSFGRDLERAARGNAAAALRSVGGLDASFGRIWI